MSDASNILKGGMEMQKGQPDSAEVEANIKQAVPIAEIRVTRYP